MPAGVVPQLAADSTPHLAARARTIGLVRGRRCQICRGLLEVFDDGPGCLHLPPCWIGFCWRCGRIVWRGRCGQDLIEDLDPSTVAMGQRFVQPAE